MIETQNVLFLVLKLNYYQIDAFTDKIFGGNPAIVVELNEWLDDKILQNIAKDLKN